MEIIQNNNIKINKRNNYQKNCKYIKPNIKQNIVLINPSLDLNDTNISMDKIDKQKNSNLINSFENNNYQNVKQSSNLTYNLKIKQVFNLIDSKFITQYKYYKKIKRIEKISHINYRQRGIYPKVIIILLFIILFSIRIKENNFIIYNNFEEIKENDIYINPYYEDEQRMYDYFLTLKKFPKNRNDPLIIKEKLDILEKVSQKTRKNITSLNIVYYDEFNRYGNQLIAFNKLIFYSEILGIKKIIIDNDNLIYIRNNIYDEKSKLLIEVNYDINKTKFKDYSLSYYINDSKIFFDNYNLKVENRFSVIKNEILRNLPKIKVNSYELYIHVRSGDIFNGLLPIYYAPSYAQPPFCFYKKIIEANNFSNIYLISEDKLNPVVDQLINKYPKIIYNNNKIEKDISSLIYAYNIIASSSSFLSATIKLNDNLKYYWEYDNMRINDKYLHMHHSLFYYSRKYTIFRMEPSDIYKRKMYNWINSQEQRNIMINDNCPNEFKYIKPNI